jgi:hypothetical protein
VVQPEIGREPDLVRVIHEILTLEASKVLIGADFRSILQRVHRLTL